MQSGAELEGVLSWFAAGVEQDVTACLAFSSELTKNQRARVHRWGQVCVDAMLMYARP